VRLTVTELILDPVGYVVSTRAANEDDHWDTEHSSIRLATSYGPQSLQGLAEFSHVEILFHFHQIAASLVVTAARHPRNNPAWPLTGIFAQRGSARPNRLGTTICRLLRIEGNVLYVSGLDAISGTPVVDIKPVMKEFLPRGTLVQPQWSHELMKNYWTQSH
jgi:tRNA-Thr(GGU) m(6)t(6)A37 methyltransferase TsaA